MQENLSFPLSTSLKWGMRDAWGFYDIGNYKNGPEEKVSLFTLTNDWKFRNDTGFQITIGYEDY